MDTLGALALATEPPNDEIMKRPPVGRSENFITMIMWRNVIGQSIYQLVVLGVLLFDGEKLFNINGEKAENTLNTFIFNTFVFCQVSVFEMFDLNNKFWYFFYFFLCKSFYFNTNLYKILHNSMSA